jgi:hypothetical protein
MQYIKKIGNYINFEKLKKEVIALQEKVKSPIISLQWRDPNDIKWDNATGFHHGPVEQEFSNIMPELIGSEIERMFDIVPYKMFRTRIMTVSPNFNYIPHADPNPRIHIPIVSNELCKFHFFAHHEVQQYMPADGSIFWVDVRNKHTFINTSKEYRIHIVAVTDLDLN